MKKPLVVIDTNLFVSALIVPHSQPALLINLWKKGAFALASSDPMIEELTQVLNRPKYYKKYHLTPTTTTKLIHLLKGKVKILPQLTKPKIAIRDAKDLVILATALDSQADYLITGDQDLLVLKGHRGLGKLHILTVTEFVHQLI